MQRISDRRRLDWCAPLPAGRRLTVGAAVSDGGVNDPNRARHRRRCPRRTPPDHGGAPATTDPHQWWMTSTRTQESSYEPALRATEHADFVHPGDSVRMCAGKYRTVPPGDGRCADSDERSRTNEKCEKCCAFPTEPRSKTPPQRIWWDRRHEKARNAQERKA